VKPFKDGNIALLNCHESPLPDPPRLDDHVVLLHA
jgi:hypothetical protein